MAPAITAADSARVTHQSQRPWRISSCLSCIASSANPPGDGGGDQRRHAKRHDPLQVEVLAVGPAPGDAEGAEREQQRRLEHQRDRQDCGQTEAGFGARPIESATAAPFRMTMLRKQTPILQQSGMTGAGAPSVWRRAFAVSAGSAAPSDSL